LSPKEVKYKIASFIRKSRIGFIVEKIRIKYVDYLTSALEIILSATVGFLIVAVLLYFMGYDPYEVFSILFRYGYGNTSYLLSKSVPYVMSAMAFSIPLLAGVFNIGGESQLYVGAFTSLLVTYYTANPVLGLLAGLLAGGGLGLFISILRVYRNINEVIAAIMINWTMYFLLVYLITGTYYDPRMPHQSIQVPKSAWLGEFISPWGRIKVSFILAIIGACVIYYILYYTNIGYLLRVSGLSPLSARYAGYNPRKAILYSMLLGGAMAGLGGALFIIGDVHSIDTTMSTLYGLGFTGIGIGLLGRNHPIGIIFAAIFFSGLLIGGQWVELKTGAPPQLTDTIIGIIVIALAIPYAYRMLISMVRRWRIK